MESLLALLPYLACPVGMGLMMWLMMRGSSGEATSAPSVSGASAATTAPRATGSADRLAQLRAQLGELQGQQAAIAEQLARLQSKGVSRR